MTKSISVSEAREKFAEITQDILVSGAIYEVVRHGKPIIKLSPIGPVETTSTITPEFKQHLDEFTTRYNEDLKALAKN